MKKSEYLASLRNHGVRQAVVTAMAARPVAEEGPKIRDCGSIADIILNAMKKSDQFFKKVERYEPVISGSQLRQNKVKDYYFDTKLSRLPGAAKYVTKYGDLDITVAPSDGDEAGGFQPLSETIKISMKRGAVTPDTVNIAPLITTDIGTLVHELRHWADARTGTYDFLRISMDKSGQPKDFTSYYSSEYEVDARLADLLVRVDRGLLNVALAAISGKPNPLTKVFAEAIKTPAAFVDFVIKSDIGFSKTSKHFLALSRKSLTEEAFEDACDKIRELWKMFYDEYGMAFKVIPKAEVTRKQLDAWKSLKEVSAGNRTVSEHVASDREAVLTPKLVKVLGPEAKKEPRTAAIKKLGFKVKESAKQKTAKTASAPSTSKPASAKRSTTTKTVAVQKKAKAPTSKQAAKKSPEPVRAVKTTTRTSAGKRK